MSSMYFMASSLLGWSPMRHTGRPEIDTPSGSRLLDGRVAALKRVEVARGRLVEALPVRVELLLARGRTGGRAGALLRAAELPHEVRERLRVRRRLDRDR